MRYKKTLKWRYIHYGLSQVLKFGNETEYKAISNACTERSRSEQCAISNACTEQSVVLSVVFRLRSTTIEMSK
ncbi:MAG TPA: hypothetical protein PLY32_00265 [Salinivirgaceae bacterium]|nr:hypothetical protein [Salinivirgaceae bacterium]